MAPPWLGFKSQRKCTSCLGAWAGRGAHDRTLSLPPAPITLARDEVWATGCLPHSLFLSTHLYNPGPWGRFAAFEHGAYGAIWPAESSYLCPRFSPSLMSSFHIWVGFLICWSCLSLIRVSHTDSAWVCGPPPHPLLPSPLMHHTL